MKTRSFWTIGLAVLAAGLPTVAHAYVGPGAGLSLVAAFWAILVAVGTIVVFTLMWPIRRMMKRKAAAKATVHHRDDAAPRADGMAHGRGAHGS